MLKEGTDHHKLYELETKLFDYQVFDKSDVETFVNSWKSGESQPKLHNILSPVVEEFQKKNKEERVGFKKTLRRYQSIYSFLSQIIPFSDVNLEKLFIFNKFLNKKLPTINDPLPFSVLEDINIDSYKIVKKGKKEIKLQSEEGEIQTISDGVVAFVPDLNAKLSKIIKDLNDAFGTDFTEDDKVFLGRVKENMVQNKELINKMEHNSKENVKPIFDKFFDQEMSELLKNDLNLYKKIVDNEKLRNQIRTSLFELIYSEYKRLKRSRKEKKI